MSKSLLSSIPLYPLKFEPIYREKVWGGNKIKTHLKQDFGQLSNCGEAWVISGVDGFVSIVKDGALQGFSLNQIINDYNALLVGDRVYQKFKNDFPLLIKFIDAADDLSVQVHPDDHLARKKHGCNGKSEMWYMMHTEPQASIIIGFNRQMTSKALKQAYEKGQVMACLNKISVNEGDIFYLPAGRVHSIGAGCLLAEIQQTSDITYRIYDFDREDASGNKRDLHVNDGIAASDFTMYNKYQTDYHPKRNEVIPVVDTPFFNTKILSIDRHIERVYETTNSFRIFICTKGEGVLEAGAHHTPLKMGEAVLVPAIMQKLSFRTSDIFELLETGIDG